MSEGRAPTGRGEIETSVGTGPTVPSLPAREPLRRKRKAPL